MSQPFKLAAGLDVQALAAQFREGRRLQISPFLEEKSAIALLNHIRSREDWRLAINAGEQVFEIDRSGQRSMTPEQWAQLDQLVAGNAEHDFQFRFETIRVPDSASERLARASMLDRFAMFMSSPPMVSFFRKIVGEDRIDFADAQATGYSAGHFLTAHDDAVEGKGRFAAYVLGLTRDWRPEWGGALRFHESDASNSEEYAPGFNRLTLFAVPQLHSVGRVAAEAMEKRYSITGWLRSAPLA